MYTIKMSHNTLSPRSHSASKLLTAMFLQQVTEVDKKRSLDSAEAYSACFLRMWSLRIFFVGGTEEETFFSSNMPICCIEFTILQCQGRVGDEYFYDLWRRSGCGAKLFGVGADAESKT